MISIMKWCIVGHVGWRQLRFVAATNSAAIEIIHSCNSFRFRDCDGRSWTRGSSFARSVKWCLLWAAQAFLRPTQQHCRVSRVNVRIRFEQQYWEWSHQVHHRVDSEVWDVSQGGPSDPVLAISDEQAFEQTFEQTCDLMLKWPSNRLSSISTSVHQTSQHISEIITCMQHLKWKCNSEIIFIISLTEMKFRRKM
jgi:hypothetical protein